MSGNIEKIVYINLDKRTDRRKEVEGELEKMGLLEKAERFPAISHREGLVGCGQSHLAVLKMARDRGYKNILVLEDDFMFLVTKEEVEQNLSLFFNSNIPYDVCLLSYNLQKSEEVLDHPFLLRVKEVQTTSGYIVNQSCYNDLIQVWEDALPKLESTMEHWNYALDQVWKVLQEKGLWYCFKERLGKQRPGWSDNSNSYAECIGY